MFKAFVVVALVALVLTNGGMLAMEVYTTFFQYGERVQEIAELARI